MHPRDLPFDEPATPNPREPNAFRQVAEENRQQRREIQELRQQLSAAAATQARTDADLTQTRLDLISSDAIREGFVKQSIGLAADMARALAAVESGFHAGYRAGRNHTLTADQAFVAWTEGLKKT